MNESIKMFTTGFAEIFHLVRNFKRTIQTQQNSKGYMQQTNTQTLKHH